MLKKLSDSAKIKLFKIDFDKVMEALRDYGKRAVSKGARVVVLIGSLARGDYTAFSDADIIIVGENFPDDFLERIKLFLDPSVPIDVQPRVYTMQEIFRMAENKNKLVKEIVDYGILLAGDTEVLDEIKRVFKFGVDS